MIGSNINNQRRAGVIILLLFVFVSFSYSQPGIQFLEEYGDAGAFEGGSALQQSKDGGFFIVGVYPAFDGLGASELYLLKIDSLGNFEWDKSFGTPGEKDVAYDLKKTSDGHYILVGEGAKYVEGRYGKGTYVIKFDEQGDTLWTRIIGGTDEAYGRTITEQPGAGYYISGRAIDSTALSPILMHLGPNGDSLWLKKYNLANDPYYRGIAYGHQPTQNGGWILAGNDNLLNSWDRRGFVLTLDGNGDTISSNVFYDVQLYSIEPCKDGGFIAVGNKLSNPTNSTLRDLFVLRLNDLGETVWTQTYPGSIGPVYLISGKETPEGGFLLIGSKNFDTLSYDAKIFIQKTNSIGKPLWSITVDSALYGRGTALNSIQTSDHGYAITGEINGNILMLKLTTDSATITGLEQKTLLDAKVYPNPANESIQIELKRNSTFQLFDSKGSLVLERLITGEAKLNIDQLTSGMYFYRIEDESGRWTSGKLVKR